MLHWGRLVKSLRRSDTPAVTLLPLLFAAHAALAAEERRQHDLQFRVTQHRELVRRNEAVLNAVTSPREATAAIAQVEQARRMLAEDEREIAAINTRLSELRATVKERDANLAATRETQQAASVSLGADRATFEARLEEIRRRRDDKAAKISRSLLARYNRIQRRERSVAIFALRGQSCGNCDTMIPMQRCNAMISTGAAEVCEGCGVLMYAAN